MRIITVHFLLFLYFGAQIINAGDDSLSVYSEDTISDLSVPSVKSIDTGSAVSTSTFKPAYKETQQNHIQQQKLKPITPDTNGTGALEIKVFPKKTEVFINTEKIGIGNQYLKDLRSGLYKISLSYDKIHTDEYILVHSGEVVHKDFALGRKLRFLIEPSFSSIWVKNYQSKGPSLDLGLQYENNYYGINYFWDVIDYSVLTLGGSFVYYHEFNYEEIISICPGAFTGFWYSYGEDEGDYYDYSYHSYDSYEELFFGGFMAKAKLGFRRVFATFTYIFLFGTGTGHGLQFGLQFMI